VRKNWLLCFFCNAIGDETVCVILSWCAFSTVRCYRRLVDGFTFELVLSFASFACSSLKKMCMFWRHFTCAIICGNNCNMRDTVLISVCVLLQICVGRIQQSVVHQADCIIYSMMWYLSAVFFSMSVSNQYINYMSRIFNCYHKDRLLWWKMTECWFLRLAWLQRMVFLYWQVQYNVQDCLVQLVSL